jgi:hypothetical protein
MAEFAGIGPETGFSSGSDGFFMVPEGGTNLLVLRDGKGLRVRASDSRIALNELDIKELNSAIRKYVAGFKYLDKDETDATIKRLWATGDSRIKAGDRIIAVRAKGRGLPHIEAAGGRKKLRVDVAILPYKSFKIAFRFLRHPDGSGTKPATKFTPGEGTSFIAKMNAVYVPQINIGFELADSDWTTTQHLYQPIGDPAFKKYILPDKHPDADTTVFLVGRWKGNDTHPNGTYYRGEKAAVVDDNPVHPQQVKADGFVVTLCHEIAHHLQHVRKLVGHHGRERVLLSTGIESTYLDKQLVADLNPW